MLKRKRTNKEKARIAFQLAVRWYKGDSVDSDTYFYEYLELASELVGADWELTNKYYNSKGYKVKR